ncbi:MAG TPA: hypothetical protein DCL44_07380 [Elusimicrobia bacterium]|nr:hypothetical protein [Elusimicrobiota bacterium]
MPHLSRPGLIWRKAAVLGSLWAASEIILGSFLHNAHVPFSGEFLTAIGIILLIAGHRLWPERGLLWRTGFICAAMKSISPSAIIFGPMLAISMEGILCEAGVRLGGGNLAGYALAGGLAMCWAPIHKLGNLLLFYGPDTLKIYLRGIEWLRQSAGFTMNNSWVPIALLLTSYFLLGTVVALAGMRAGTTEGSVQLFSSRNETVKPDGQQGNTNNTNRKYSKIALLLHLSLVAVVMAYSRLIPAQLFIGGTAAYAYICARSYPRALALLKHTGLWIGILVTSLLAGVILGSAASGFYMALRAFILTVGFAAIGEGLLNPAIRSRLESLCGGVFFETLESAFLALPGIIAGLPSGREFARRPLAVLGGMVARAPFLLDSMQGSSAYPIRKRPAG